MSKLAGNVFLCFAALACAATHAVAQESRQAVAAAQSAAAEQDDKAWKKFSPTGGGFEVMLPGTPAGQEQAVETKVGKLVHHMYLLETGVAVYMVSYAEFPEPVSDPAVIKLMLDGGRDKALSATGGTLKSEKEIKLQGHAGREWLVGIPGGGEARARAYWVKKRLYQAVILMPEAKEATPAAVKLRQDTTKKFLDSFALSDAHAAT